MQVGAESARPSGRAVLRRAQVGPRVPPCDSLGKRCSNRASRGGGWGALVQGPDRPLSGTLAFKLTGSQPPPTPLACWGQLPGSDSTGKLMSSG